MFILRSVTQKDLDDLYRLAKLVNFINLPADRSIISKKISSSICAFNDPPSDLHRNYYLFVLEDLTEKKVAGISMIHAQHGSPNAPHFYLDVGQENKFSKTINTGFVHGTLKLGIDTNGPSEIGGLVIHPDYRNRPEKLGKQLSFVRFLYMSMRPKEFKDTVHSELMPPLDSQGNSPLWEAVGRKFMNMEYQEADLLARKNKEFILNLFPSEIIYETLLPLNARNAIGKIGDDTEPVKRMLEDIGFKYVEQVDPFDGGPHYRCKLKDIKPIKNHFKREITSGEFITKDAKEALVAIKQDNHSFFAIKAKVQFTNNNKVTLDPNILKEIKIENPHITIIELN